MVNNTLPATKIKPLFDDVAKTLSINITDQIDEFTHLLSTQSMNEEQIVIWINARNGIAKDAKESNITPRQSTLHKIKELRGQIL